MIKGKVVLVPFPFDDLSSVKLRPAVCLSNSIGRHNHVILAFMTSHIIENKLESDVIIDFTKDKFDLTGLRVASSLRLHRLITVSTSIIKRELGKIPKELQIEIDKKLRRLFRL